MRVGMRGQLLVDLLGQGLDLLGEGGQDGEQGRGDVRLCGAVVTGCATAPIIAENDWLIDRAERLSSSGTKG